MNDFASLLNDMVVLQNGISLMEADPAAPEEAEEAGPAKAKSLPEMIKLLRKMAIAVNDQVKIMDEKLDGMLTTLGVSVDEVETQFAGLRHMTSEQQAHITQITTDANTRIKKLKKELEPLTKMKGAGSVQELVNKVQELEGSLQKKQQEMDTQKQEYEDLLDYYEEIMVDMKHAEMEAKRELQNANAAMTGAWDHTELFGEPITEAKKPEKPKKKKKKRKLPESYQYYGTFDLNEHLSKAREKLPKSAHDW